jgi:uncharacterized coiled-coil protein SlyX
MSTMSVQPAVVHAEELSELHQLVLSQQLVIKKLQSQLDYVLSFLGITDMLDESASVDNFTARRLPNPSLTQLQPTT